MTLSKRKPSILAQFKKAAKTGNLSTQEGNFSLLFSAGMVASAYPPYFDKYYDQEIGTMVYFQKGKNGLFIFEWEKYIQTTLQTYRKYLKNPNLVALKEYAKIEKTVEDLYRKYPTSVIDKMTRTAGKDLLNDLFHYFRTVIAGTLFCESIDESQIGGHYREIRGSEQGFKGFYEKASIPCFESFVLRANKALLRHPEDRDRLQYIFASYRICPSVHGLEREIAAMIDQHGGEKQIKNDILNLRGELKKNKKEVNRYRKTLRGDMKKLFDFSQLSMELRDTRKETIQKIIALASNTVRMLLKNRNVDSDYAPFVYYKDFHSKFFDSRSYQKELDKRKNRGVIMLFSQKGMTMEYGDSREKRDKFFALLDRNDDEMSELKGSIAYTGRVEGIVRVINNEDDFVNFGNGNILVTSMTRPEFVPLMKKALAIITDEGGITCHAAIVSRELKIPCIVGTKFATRVLKDEDTVEVDAEKGIVRIKK